MTKTELDSLLAESKRLDSAADSGPWATLIQGNGESQYCDIVQAEDTCAIVCVLANSDRELDNAQFIALSRTALPALVAEVERLQRVVDQAVELSRLQILPAVEGLPEGFTSSPRVLRGTDEHPDLYAELKAREK